MIRNIVYILARECFRRLWVSWTVSGVYVSARVERDETRALIEDEKEFSFFMFLWVTYIYVRSDARLYDCLKWYLLFNVILSIELHIGGVGSLRKH